METESIQPPLFDARPSEQPVRRRAQNLNRSPRGPRLYLIESRARSTYLCAGCGATIRTRSRYFRHDPIPQARLHRREQTTHWCRSCILDSDPPEPEPFTGRIRMPRNWLIKPREEVGEGRPSVLLLGIGAQLIERLRLDPKLLHDLTPEQFEDFVCDRLYVWGMEPRKVGRTNQMDGGIDVVFWPRSKNAFPFLGAAQVKHHRRSVKEGPNAVREFAGVLSGHPFNAGLFVTNTAFTPQAKWFAEHSSALLRLRDFEDMRRWIASEFDDPNERREIPRSLELFANGIVDLRVNSRELSR